MTPEPISVVRGGEPTDEEMAAIAGAAAVLLLAPSGAAPVEATVPRWRFSGRWWTRRASRFARGIIARSR